MITYEKGEKVISIKRHFRGSFTFQVIVLIILFFLPYIAYKNGLTNFFISLFNPTATNPFFLSMAFYILWILFLWILFWIAWTNYYLSAKIRTNQRVIKIKHTGFFKWRIDLKEND